VADPAQKVELYQKIIALSSLEECDDLEEEIQDRFGDLPDAVRNLLQIARIKVLARFLGLASISVRGSRFQLKFLEGLGIDANKYAELHSKYRGKIAYRHGRVGQLLVEKDQEDEKALAFLAEVLSACLGE
jgi:transcription-repair coupling factor (superfamily II helicase)